jgi:hypothetical protein
MAQVIAAKKTTIAFPIGARRMLCANYKFS